MSWFSFKSPPLTPNPGFRDRNMAKERLKTIRRTRLKIASSGHYRTIYSTHRAVPPQDLRKNMPTNLLAGSVQGVKRPGPQLKSNGLLMTSAGRIAVFKGVVPDRSTMLPREALHSWVCVCVPTYTYVYIYMDSKIGLSGLFKIKQRNG